MCRVHANNMLGEAQHSFAELVGRHYCAQVAHGLAVLLGIRDRGERVQSAIILRQWFDVRPRLVVVIVFGHSLLAHR